MLRVVGTGHQEGSVETGFLQESGAHSGAEIEELLELRLILDRLVSRHRRCLHRAVEDIRLTVTVTLIGFARQVIDFFHRRGVSCGRAGHFLLETTVHFHTHTAVTRFHDYGSTVAREEILLIAFHSLRVITTVYDNVVVHHFDEQRTLHRTECTVECLVSRRSESRTVKNLIAGLLSRSRFVSHRPSIDCQSTRKTTRVTGTETIVTEVRYVLRIGHRSRIHITVGVQAFVFRNEERETALHRLEVSREVLLQRSAAIIRTLDVRVVSTNHRTHHLRIAIIKRRSDNGRIVCGRNHAIHHINHTVVGQE